MQFEFTRQNLKGREYTLQRCLEILPGLTSWIILSATVGLVLFKPVWAAVIIIAFYFFWSMRLLYMTIFLTLSYYRLKTESDTDWMARIAGIDDLDNYLKTLKLDYTEFNIKKSSDIIGIINGTFIFYTGDFINSRLIERISFC